MNRPWKCITPGENWSSRLQASEWKCVISHQAEHCLIPATRKSQCSAISKFVLLSGFLHTIPSRGMQICRKRTCSLARQWHLDWTAYPREKGERFRRVHAMLPVHLKSLDAQNICAAWHLRNAPSSTLQVYCSEGQSSMMQSTANAYLEFDRLFIDTSI